MNKILIVTDTTSALSFEEANKHGIAMLPLSVMINGQEYKDLVDLSAEDLAKKLQEGAVPTTSQPSPGLIEVQAEEWKKENYDAILIYTIAKSLSGTYQSFVTACERVGLPQVQVIDTQMAAGILRYCVLLASEMAKQGKSADEILTVTNTILEKGIVYIVPKTLDQLKKGGRVSAAAAAMSSLLKIKPILALKRNAASIDKMAMARTDAKVYSIMIEDMKKNGVTAQDYFLYIPFVDETEQPDCFIETVRKEIPNIECIKIGLPAVLTAHVGLGAFGVQPILRNKDIHII